MPIVRVVPLPAKVITRDEAAVTVPVPKFKLELAEVLADVPNVKPFVELPSQTTALLPKFVTAVPEVLLIVLLAPSRVSVPVPSALPLFTFKVPAVTLTPPDAAELFPLKVNVPPAAFIVVSPV